MVEKGENCTVRNVGDQRKKEEGPAHGIKESFFELVKLEVLVAYALAVDSDTLDGEDAVFFAQPAAVELVVRDYK